MRSVYQPTACWFSPVEFIKQFACATGGYSFIESATAYSITSHSALYMYQLLTEHDIMHGIAWPLIWAELQQQQQPILLAASCMPVTIDATP